MRFIRNILLFVAGMLTGRRSRRSVRPGTHPEIPFWTYGWVGFWKRLAFLVPFLLLGGFLVAASGIVSIKASSGHFAITRWLLEFSMERSVATYSMGIQAPALEDPALVVKGAGHYETGCRPCHGGVGDLQPGIPKQMTPKPPPLPGAVPKWSDAELFYIVKHGVKLTGMPAFPSLERDDEVWSIVAFLKRLPEMSVPEYQRLVFGSERDDALADTSGVVPTGLGAADTTGLLQNGMAVADTTGILPTGTVGENMRGVLPAGTAAEGEAFVQADTSVAREALASERSSRAVAPIAALPTDLRTVEETCRRCHGEGGRGREVSAYPRLAGQKADYLYAALLSYSRGARHSGMMEPVAAALTAEEMRALATYFSRARVQPSLRTGAENRSGAGAQQGADDRNGLDGSQGPSDRGARLSNDPEDVARSIARGREIAFRGIPREKVPSCRDCHGPDAARTNSFYPVLAGQYAEYLLLQLKLFAAGKRGGSTFEHLMRPTATKLTNEQMRDVALYYESLGGMPASPIASYTESILPGGH